MSHVPYVVFETRAAGANKRAQRAGAEGTITADDLLALWLVQDRDCPYSETRFSRYSSATVDHIEPLKRGGENRLGNVVYVKPYENNAKADLTLREYCQQTGRDFQTVQHRLERIHRKLRLVGLID